MKRNDCEGAPAKAKDAFTDLGFAKADTSRAARQGTGEVIYGQGKSVEQIASIAAALRQAGQPRVLITRMDAAKAADLARVRAESGSGCGRALPWDDHRKPGDDADELYYDECASLGFVGKQPVVDGQGRVAVVCAGTSDLPVAREAALTAKFLGNDVFSLTDVGIAGLHRLLAFEDQLRRCRVIVAVAGMDGALPSALGGLVSCPVIAVPTSVGYGANFGGLAALLTMLNSCASGVSVVNIDNGFGAGYQASLINHLT